jgi:hypothetical protein
VSNFLLVLAYLGALVGLAAVLLLLDALLLGLANCFANRSAEYRHRVGSQYPRIPQDTP